VKEPSGFFSRRLPPQTPFKSRRLDVLQPKSRFGHTTQEIVSSDLPKYQKIEMIQWYLQDLQDRKKAFKEHEHYRWENRSKDDTSMGPYEAIKGTIEDFNARIQECEEALRGLGFVNLTDTIDLTGESDEEFLTWWRQKARITTTEFGRRRRMTSWGTFMKRYRRKNPRASARTITNKYRRAQLLFA
jgi:hypothetical protein